MKWPFVWKKQLVNLTTQHKYELDQLRQAHSKGLQKEKDRIDNELILLRQVIKSVVDTKIEYGPPDFPHFRLQITMNPNFVKDGLIHGDSQHMIEYIADGVKYQVIEELRTMNFVRFREFDFAKRVYRGE